MIETAAPTGYGDSSPETFGEKTCQALLSDFEKSCLSSPIPQASPLAYRDPLIRVRSARLRGDSAAVILGLMTDVTHLLNAIEHGDPRAANQLLPLVYEELRRLAAQKLARENPGQTLQPTALVHEAYLRLVGTDAAANWDNRGHFFAAAAEAMRRVLVESARSKKRLKHGGGRGRLELTDEAGELLPVSDELLDLDDALTRLAAEDAAAAAVVQLHFFGGLTLEQVAETLAVSRATVYRHWAYARAWLHCALGEERKS